MDHLEKQSWGLNEDAREALQELSDHFLDQPIELPGYFNTVLAADWLRENEYPENEMDSKTILFDAIENHSTRIFGGLESLDAALKDLLSKEPPSLCGPGNGSLPDAAGFLNSHGFINGQNGRNMSMSDIRQALQEHEGTVMVSNDGAFRWQFEDGSAVVTTHDTIGLGVSRDCLDIARENIDENFIPVSGNGSKTIAPDPLFVIPEATPVLGIKGINVLSGMEYTGRVGSDERARLVPLIPCIRLDSHLSIDQGAEIQRDADSGLER